MKDLDIDEKKIVAEIKKNNKLEQKKRKKVQKRISKAFLLKEEAMEIRKKRYVFETIVIIICLIFMLVLLCNRTFFREEYKTSKISIDIPVFMFYLNDDGEEIEFKTLRKSKYVREYFDSYISRYSKYDCNGEVFYYDDVNRTAIYDILVEKKFAVKTVKIIYKHGEINDLCAM